MKFFIVILFRKFFNKLSLLIQVQKKFLRQMMMNLLGSPVIDIKRYTEFFKRFFDLLIVGIDNFTWRHTFFLSFNGDSGTMLVRTTNVHDIFIIQAQKAHINIARNICPRKVAYMQGAIRIRKSGSNGVTFFGEIIQDIVFLMGCTEKLIVKLFAKIIQFVLNK